MKKINRMTNIAVIAAIYFVLSMALQALTYNAIQIRVAEALIVTAIVSKDGIYGTTLGCLITNSIGVALSLNNFGVTDIVFGTLLTLISSIMAYKLKDIVTNISILNIKQLPLISLMMPVLVNAIGLPFVFAFAFHQGLYLNVYLLEFLFVFIGQFVSCVIIGSFVYISTEKSLKKHLN